ncbi:MAG: hypothetical protein KKD28_12305, partial [Chloroflexi bacterium]|nr:hypothetical protein [Chloroflexota bacterium]
AFGAVQVSNLILGEKEIASSQRAFLAMTILSCHCERSFAERGSLLHPAGDCHGGEAASHTCPFGNDIFPFV